MPEPTVSDLLLPPTLDDVRALMLSFLGTSQNPVTDWYSGAVLRTMMELEAAVVLDLVAGALPIMVENGYVDTAEKESLTVLARGWFAKDRGVAAVAIQVVTLACDATHGPYDSTAVSAMFGLATDGSVYVPTTTGTLSTGSTLAIDMTAQSPGAARGLVASLQTPVPGVSIQSAAIKVISSVPQFGADAETDTALKADCDTRFGDLSATPSEDRIITWTKQASATPTRFRIDADSVNAGAVYLTLADPSGGVVGGVVTTVQNYLDAHAPITDYITAQSASNVTINAGGTVYCKNALIPAAKVAADAQWTAYLASAQIGAQVYLLELIQAVMDAGATNFVGALLNGVAANVALTSTQVPVPGTLPSGLTWVGV